MRFKAEDYRYLYHREKPALGHYVLVSANRVKGDNYEVAYGLYRINGLETDSAAIMLDGFETESRKMDYAAIECFLRSRGSCTEFLFDLDNRQVSVYPSENRDPADAVIIYPVPTPTPEISTPNTE